MTRSRLASSTRALLVCALSILSACGGCDPDEQQLYDSFFEPYDYGVYEPIRQPAIEAPDRVLFGELADGEQVTRRVEIKNTGRAPLTFEAWSVSAGFSLRFEGFMDGAQPAALEPKATVVALITYRAGLDTPLRGTLSIRSDATNASVKDISLEAQVRRPCLTVRPAERLDFGLVPPSGSTTGTVILESCSASEVTVVRPGLNTNTRAFTLRMPADSGGSIVLEPGERVELPLIFAPTGPGSYRAELELSSNDPERPTRTVELVGEGAPYDCPSAAITAAVTTRNQRVVANPTGRLDGLPLDRVYLDTSASSSPDSRITRVEWAVIQRPTDSAAMLVSPDSSVTNELFLDLTGEYVVELNVWDERGTRSCTPARLRLVATPDQDIHVQLVWDTPNDREQLDENGADVDLHLLHQSGQWNARPWDCFWQNLEPDWGVFGDPSDNPSLDIDDVDGWGPENINLDNPQLDTTYSVGVHYFSDHGFGPSYATTRVYVGGQLRDESRRKRLTDQQFWHVLDISWPDATITKVDQLYLTFPER